MPNPQTAEAFVPCPATEQDMASVLNIYLPFVQRSSVTMEETPPTLAEMLQRFHDTRSKNLPFLVAKSGGEVVGYAYAFPYRTRSGYRYTVEESVYVAQEYHGRGIGLALLNMLAQHCRDAGYKQMVAVIAGGDNAASLNLHTRAGFTHCGTLQAVGCKFGQWVDTVLMQKSL